MKAPPGCDAFFALSLLTALAVTAYAQAPQLEPAAPVDATSTTAASFEVASVRPGDSHPPMLPPGISPISRFPTNRFFAHNTNLKLIIAVAFGIDEGNIEGGPGWLEGDNYSIDAKVEGDRKLTHEQI